MQIRTHRNGGDASLQAVAEAWKNEVHEFHWSEDKSDKQAVELGKRLLDEELKAGPAHPDPRNVHH
jgi:hypothetical protein